MTRVQLTIADWLLAGQGLLREGGAPAVKLSALTQRLGVTSGSFYHHFGDFPAYLDALADFYGADQVDAVVMILDAVEDPLQRIRRMRTLADELDAQRLDTGMRVWATTNDRARAAVTRMDTALLEILRDAFRELGYDKNQARIRATLAFGAGIGTMLIFGETYVRPDDAMAALDLLTASPMP